MCGCTSFAAASASRRKRSATSASRARCGCSTLITTLPRELRLLGDVHVRHAAAAEAADHAIAVAGRAAQARDLFVRALERRALELGQRLAAARRTPARRRAIPGSALRTEHRVSRRTACATKSYGAQGPVTSKRSSDARPAAPPRRAEILPQIALDEKRRAQHEAGDLLEAQRHRRRRRAGAGRETTRSPRRRGRSPPRGLRRCRRRARCARARRRDPRRTPAHRSATRSAAPSSA